MTKNQEKTKKNGKKTNSIINIKTKKNIDKKTKQLYNKLADELDVYLVYTDKNGDWKTFVSPGMQKRIVD